MIFTISENELLHAEGATVHEILFEKREINPFLSFLIVHKSERNYIYISMCYKIIFNRSIFFVCVRNSDCEKKNI